MNKKIGDGFILNDDVLLLKFEQNQEIFENYIMDICYYRSVLDYFMMIHIRYFSVDYHTVPKYLFSRR